MENINLPTYDTIVHNKVFGRKVDPMILPTGKQIPATQVSKLARFKVPSENKVINFIRNATKDFTFYQPLQLILMLLPEIERERIIADNELSLQHLRNHCPYDLEEGRTYVEVLNGVVPTEILERARIATSRDLFHGENGEEDIYHKIIKEVGKDEWTLRIRLTKEGLLPEASELEYLLDREVRDSKPLYIEGASKSYPDVANHARLLYGISGLMGYIQDSSKQFLNQRACLTVKGIVTCITTNDFVYRHMEEEYEGGASVN